MNRKKIIIKINDELKKHNLKEFLVYEKHNDLILKKGNNNLAKFGLFDPDLFNTYYNDMPDFLKIIRNFEVYQNELNAISLFYNNFIKLSLPQRQLVNKLKDQFVDFDFYLLCKDFIGVYKDGYFLTEVGVENIKVDEDIFEILDFRELTLLHEITMETQKKLGELENE